MSEAEFWDACAEAENGCLEWRGSGFPGYGNLRFDGNVVYAHRLAWELQHGEIPKGLCVLHSCDNPPCVRHLFLGTKAENNADMVAKGRNSRGEKHSLSVSGERNGQAKLSNGQVEAIRRRYAAGGITQKALAKEYGVGRTHICDIVNNNYRKSDETILG